MSGERFLLLWPQTLAGAQEHWVRLIGGHVAGRGNAWSSVSPGPGDKPEDVILIAPGAEVALHWVEIPSASGAQAQAAARLLASEVSATPIENLHVAVAEDQENGLRPMAIVDAGSLRAWINHAQANGFDPDGVIPEPLLLLPPANGVSRLAGPDIDLVRGANLAFGADSSLTSMMVEGEIGTIDQATFEAEIKDALALQPLDLRQGPFARRQRWGIPWPTVRRMALCCAGIVAAILLVQIILIVRYSIAATRLERQQDEVARSALPRGVNVANAPAQIAERLASLRGGGRGFTETAAALFDAVKVVPTAEIQSLQFDEQGELRASVSGLADTDVQAVASRINTDVFAADMGALHAGGGRKIAEITMRAK